MYYRDPEFRIQLQCSDRDEQDRSWQELQELQEELLRRRERRAKEKSAGQRFEKAVQGYAEGKVEVKAATSNKAQADAKRLWRASNPEWPRAHLRGSLSFSKLSNKDTISRDGTIGNEAGMDDLLACVGKRMMKNPFLKESRDETSNGGGGLEGDFMGSRIHLPTAQPAAERSKPFFDVMSLLNDD